MLFVTVRSASAEDVPKVLRVVEEIKRLRYKAGKSFVRIFIFLDADQGLSLLCTLDEEELHQYVTYDNAAKSSSAERKSRRRIKLDDPEPSETGSGAYTAPKSLVIHLSKIDMPELRPKTEVQPVSAEDAVRKRAWEKEWARMQAAAAAETRLQEEGKSSQGKGKEKPKEREKERDKGKGREKEVQKEREKMIERDRKLAEKEQKKLSKKGV